MFIGEFSCVFSILLNIWCVLFFYRDFIKEELLLFLFYRLVNCEIDWIVIYVIIILYY